MVDELITIDLFEKAMCSLLKSITGLEVINERNPGPQYPNSYVSLRTLDGENEPHPEINYGDIPNLTPDSPDGADTGRAYVNHNGSGYEETIIDRQYFKVQIKIVGKDAFSKLTRFRTMLNSAERYKDIFKVAGFGGADSVQNISVQENSRIQEQAVLNTYWYLAIEQRTEVDYFNKAQVPVENYDLDLIIPKE